MAHSLTKHQYDTLAGLRDGVWHPAAELVRAGLDAGQVRRALRSLSTFGRVARRDEGKQVLWRITEVGRQALAAEQTIRAAEAALRE